MEGRRLNILTYITIMKLLKGFALAFLFLVPCLCLCACGSDEDAPQVETTKIAGNWKCTECEVQSIDFSEMQLPSFATDLIKEQIESSMVGSTITVDPKKVSVDGNVVVFKDSGIKWHIQSLSDNTLVVIYNTENEYQSISLKMKIQAKFIK